MNQFGLKEWAVAVRAMEAGIQDVIFRKGGIQEPEGDFRLTHQKFLLYPAREHQKSQYLKPQFLPLLDETLASQKGQLVTIRSHAIVRRYHLIQSIEEALPFEERHIWNNDFIQMRLDYKPDRPLYIIELKIQSLTESLEFLETQDYAGCRSWVELQFPL